MNLPEQFTSEMKTLLGEDYLPFMASYEEHRHYGLRLNKLKNNDTSRNFIIEGRRQVRWCPDGYYYSSDERPAKDPYYFAGSYYIQEPSAMTAASALQVKPGDKVIDLCAAPGGKSTQIASELMGDGLLVSNDISAGRVKTMKKNMEQSGVRNGLIVSESPTKLAMRWPTVFDKVIVDAPCSGEGMFRKEPKLITSWQKEGPEDFVPIQREILEAAHELLAAGGELVYSTCTYNMKENEDNIAWFMSTYPEYDLVDIKSLLGVSSGFHSEVNAETTRTARVWPHKHQGEGHFVAKLRKREGATCTPKLIKPVINKEQKEVFEAFLKDLKLTFTQSEMARLNVVKDTLYMLPETSLDIKGLRVFSNGWLLGSFKKNRFEPSQAFASGLTIDDNLNVVDYKHDDTSVIDYLKGNTLAAEKENGWYLVCVDGLGLGFGKVVNRRLKNKLEPTWRWQ